MRKLLSSLTLGVCLLTPIGVVTAQDHPSHQWSDSENPTWHQWLKDNHHKDHDWSRATKREQAAYWRWRDQHHDDHHDDHH